MKKLRASFFSGSLWSVQLPYKDLTCVAISPRTGFLLSEEIVSDKSATKINRYFDYISNMRRRKRYDETCMRQRRATRTLLQHTVD
jgi:hypothetical protein